MSKKTILNICGFIGMTVGALVPMLWGNNGLGYMSVLTGLIGGMIGLWLGAKLAKWLS